MSPRPNTSIDPLIPTLLTSHTFIHPYTSKASHLLNPPALLEPQTTGPPDPQHPLDPASLDTSKKPLESHFPWTHTPYTPKHLDLNTPRALTFLNPPHFLDHTLPGPLEHCSLISSRSPRQYITEPQIHSLTPKQNPLDPYISWITQTPHSMPDPPYPSHPWAEYCVQFWSSISWVGLLSLIKFHSIDNNNARPTNVIRNINHLNFY